MIGQYIPRSIIIPNVWIEINPLNNSILANLQILISMMIILPKYHNIAKSINSFKLICVIDSLIVLILTLEKIYYLLS